MYSFMCQYMYNAIYFQILNSAHPDIFGVNELSCMGDWFSRSNNLLSKQGKQGQDGSTGKHIPVSKN